MPTDKAEHLKDKDGSWSDSMGASGQPKMDPSAFWRLVATMSSLGWNLAVPIVGGALLGSYLDRITGREFVWTVGLLFAGMAISLYNLYHILYKEIEE